MGTSMVKQKKKCLTSYLQLIFFFFKFEVNLNLKTDTLLEITPLATLHWKSYDSCGFSFFTYSIARESLLDTHAILTLRSLEKATLR